MVNLHDQSWGSRNATHYRWVAQLWSRHDIQGRASAIFPQKKSSQSEDRIWHDPKAAPTRARIFSGIICALRWISPQLHWPVGKRREKPIPESPLRPGEELRYASIGDPTDRGKATRVWPGDLTSVAVPAQRISARSRFFPRIRVSRCPELMRGPGARQGQNPEKQEVPRTARAFAYFFSYFC
jgi:hypothetical protein